MLDLEIIELYWLRQERAIEETDRKYGPYCLRIASNILAAEDARECVNDTYLAAWNAMPPQRPTKLSAFLAKLTRSLSLDRWRYLHAQKRGGGQVDIALTELSECICGAGDPEASIQARELAKAVSGFLRTLPGQQRRLFVMRYFYLQSLEEICEACAMPMGTAKSMLHRIRKKLHAHLRKEGYL